MAAAERYANILPDVDFPGTKDFWQGCRNRRLSLPRCLRCGRYHWYPMPACPSCQATTLEWAPVSGRATLFTWTEVRHAFLPELADRLPVLVALVLLEEAPEIRLVTNLVDCQESELKIGLPLEAAFVDVNPAVTMPLFLPRASDR